MKIFARKKTFRVCTTDGKGLTVKIPPPAPIDSFFVFSLHKCGSTLINNMIVDVCNYLKISWLDLEGTVFKHGYMPVHLKGDLSSLFSKVGYAYVGFRSFWIGQHYDATQNRCLLLIRDPRDAMVSHYFSYLYSHGIPDSGPISQTMSKNRKKLADTDINAYVLRPQIINTYKNAFKQYDKSLSSEKTQVYRYEDVIYTKREWLTDMLHFLNLEVPTDIISNIVRKHDVLPLQEDPSKHIRQVAPGNYLSHLKKKTIEKLNEEFADILSQYGWR